MVAENDRIVKDRPYFAAFSQFQQIGSVRLRKLLNFFPDLRSAWLAGTKELVACGLEQAVAEKLAAERPGIDPESVFSDLMNQNINLVTLLDPEYPKLLKEVSDPPVVLYVRGNIAPQDELAIAVVGSRKYSPYGKRVAQDMAADLVRAGITVISGLAFGIDAFAHEAAVAGNGRTIAVLACGVDAIYPSSNRLIADRILQGNGAVISEFPPRTPPLRHHFPIRNRIISGLALGTIVVEAAPDSGALITAQHALDQNRQVYAVPGSIYNAGSEGPNNLLKLGAKPITNIADVLEDLNLEPGFMGQELPALSADNGEESLILSLLSREPVHFNELTKISGLSAASLAAQLTIMEMKGKVKNLGANQYVKMR